MQGMYFTSLLCALGIIEMTVSCPSVLLAREQRELPLGGSRLGTTFRQEGAGEARQ